MELRELTGASWLGVRVLTPPPAGRDVTFDWLTSNELIDPTPFVQPGCLLVVSGIGMNIRDPRTWAAYVERLTEAGVAVLAFRAGAAHQNVPDGLLTACARAGLPLLLFGGATPYSTVERFVTDKLRAEASRAQAAAWRLAERLAQAAGSGAELSSMLQLVSEELSASVSVVDESGHAVTQWPPGAAPERGTEVDQTAVPVAGASGLSLVVHGPGTRMSGGLLTPIASILGLQLERLLPSSVSRHGSLFTELREQLDSWEVPGHVVRRTLSGLGFESVDDLVVLVAPDRAGIAGRAYSLRLALGARADTVRVGVGGGWLIAVVGGLHEVGVGALLADLQARHADLPVALAGPVHDVEHLRRAFLSARARSPVLTRPARVPSFDVIGWAAGNAAGAARRAAAQFLAPVLHHDARHGSELMLTLRALCDGDGRPGRLAETLHVHRNTVAYRLGQLESLLGVSVTAPRGLSACVVAVDLLDSTADPRGGDR